MSKVEQILTDGLLAGYAEGSKRLNVYRGGTGDFLMRGIYFETPEGDRYRDEWIADRVGSGQEIVKTSNGHMFTRSYGGGTISEESLEKMRFTKNEVTTYLKKKLKELESQTRLFEDCVPESDGDMQYSYKITSKELDIPITTAREEITHEGKTLFIHHFILCPVE